MIKKLMCKWFGHIPTNEKLVFKSDTSELKTFKAKCSRCGCNLIGKEDIGEFSKTLIKVFVELT